MAAEIKTLHGDIPEGSGLQNEILIEMLEDLLTKAKSGDIVALGFFGVKPNKSIFSGWDGASKGYLHQLLAASRIIEYRILRMNVLEESD